MELRKFAESLRAAGVTIVQYRNKTGAPQEVLRGAAHLQEVFAGTAARLIMNDRADLAVLAGFSGVHVGQGDLLPEDARRIVGLARWIGVSTHTEEQAQAADASCADYIAVGPVFATGTKLDAEPVIGLHGVRRVRALSAKPIVAIGGIARENALSVIEAGADSVAVISALVVQGESVETVARDFLDIFG